MYTADAYRILLLPLAGKCPISLKGITNLGCCRMLCKLFGVVAEAAKDKLITVKLNFFLSVPKVVKLFFEQYQSDKSLLSIFAEDILQLVNIDKLCKFDFPCKNVHASANDVSIGVVGDKLLKEKLFKEQVCEKQVVVFKYLCQKFVLMMFEKSISCSYKMKSVLIYFVHKKKISCEDCDNISIQFGDFRVKVVGQSLSEFLNYGRKEGLDTFLSGYFLKNGI
ncbi:hypothetical protein PR048_006278 [Dryococelus australis]|uniref:Uncharacterized protein n=1 Tax=Dryococelus australis TaxID=614101 RepID=A0ABQ9ICR2_9NEOP|nr:hypothetical protein PR048_006278 [Dryococelus australis]